MSEADDGEEVLFTEGEGERPNRRAGAKAKAKAAPAPTGKAALAELIFDQVTNDLDIGSGGSLNKLQEMLDKELQGLDNILEAQGADNQVRYKGVTTPTEVRKRLLMVSKYHEAKSLFKIEDSITSELANEGGILFLKLMESYNETPNKSIKTYRLELKLVATDEEAAQMEVDRGRIDAETKDVDVSKLSEEDKKKHTEKTELLRTKISGIEVLAEKRVEILEEIERSKERQPTSDERKELHDFLIETNLGAIFNFGLKCQAEGCKQQDISDFICAGVVGKELWTVAQFIGGAFCAFGPAKLKNQGNEGKGARKGSASKKSIKTTTEGHNLLMHLKEKSDQVMELMQAVVGGEVSPNSMIGCSAELCIGAGLNDRGRSLLNFQFKSESLGIRKKIFARSIAELTLSDKSKNTAKSKRTLDLSVLILYYQSTS